MQISKGPVSRVQLQRLHKTVVAIDTETPPFPLSNLAASPLVAELKKRRSVALQLMLAPIVEG